MKKYLLALFVVATATLAQAQSVTLVNLANLTGLGNKQAGEDIAARKVFKLESGEEVDGFLVEHYQTVAQPNKLETLIIGQGFKLATGGVLHTVSYNSPNVQNVINLMGQVRSINVKQTFHGADSTDNIYIFDSALYRMTVRLNLNGNYATVDLSQKQVLVD